MFLYRINFFFRDGVLAATSPYGGSLITANYNTTVAGVYVNNTYSIQQPLFMILPNPNASIVLAFKTVLFYNVSQSFVNETVGTSPLIISINGATESILSLDNVNFVINRAFNSLVSVQNTLGIVVLTDVSFISNYNSEALYLYNVAFMNASSLNCYQNNFFGGVINPLGGACLNLRNVVTKLMDILEVVECKSLNTSAGIKIFNDDTLNSMLPVFTAKGLIPATQITNFNFTNNYANYTLFNEIGSAIYIDSIFPLAIDKGIFYVKYLKHLFK